MYQKQFLTKLFTLALILLFTQFSPVSNAQNIRIFGFNKTKKAFRNLDEGNFKKAEELFLTIKEDDSTDISANYGLAVLYSTDQYSYHDYFIANLYIEKTKTNYAAIQSNNKKTDDLYETVNSKNIDSLDAVIDKKLFDYIQQANKMHLFDKFLRERPKSAYREQVAAAKQQLIIAKAYQDIKTSNTLIAYNQFIEKYPNAPQADSAKSIRNKMAFAVAKEKNTIEAYQNFVKTYPEAKQVTQVQNKIKELPQYQFKQLIGRYDRYYNDVARFLAGDFQTKGSSLKELETNTVWREHQKTFGDFFAKLETKRIPQMQEFSKNELGEVNKNMKTLFYPFGGPDFIHAHTFFPNSEQIIMFGLERVGKIPDINDLSNKRMETFFKAIKISLDSLLTWSYFMTNDMRKDFARSLELRGVLPVLLIFIEKADFYVLDVNHVTIDKTGKIKKLYDGKNKNANMRSVAIKGVEIKYAKVGDKKERVVYYFSHNVSDDNLKRTPQFVKFIKSQDITASFLKAASYLCRHFETVRNLVLTESEYVLQTASGVPFKYFDEKKWDINYYGNYLRPISQFNWCMQPKLRAKFKEGKNVKPLDFGIGYGFRFDASNLILAKKK